MSTAIPQDVLDKDGNAVGPWVPDLDVDTLRALEDALSDLQRSAFGAGAMGAGPDESNGGLAVAAVAQLAKE